MDDTINLSTTSDRLRLVRKTHKETSDHELILLCQHRDREAFEELVKRNRRTVYYIFKRMAPHLDTADLEQDLFIRIWRHIGSLRNPKAFQCWLKRIATHSFYDLLRRQSTKLPTRSMDAPAPFENDDCAATTQDIADKTAGPEQLLQGKEMDWVLRRAIEQLPEQFRTALRLRELEGLSYKEIAIATHANMDTVKSRICRARKRVQAIVYSYLKMDG